MGSLRSRSTQGPGPALHCTTALEAGVSGGPARALDEVRVATSSSNDRLGWELQCVEEAQRGNRRAFVELYTAFAPPLYAEVLLPRLGNAVAAEDAQAGGGRRSSGRALAAVPARNRAAHVRRPSAPRVCTADGSDHRELRRAAA